MKYKHDKSSQENVMGFNSMKCEQGISLFFNYLHKKPRKP